MNSRDDDRRSGRDWREDAEREWRERGQGQQEAFQRRGSQMGGTAYRGREPAWVPEEDGGAPPREHAGRSERRFQEGDDYGRGYWGNDFDRGDVGSSRDSLRSHVRDSWRTHSGPASRFGGAGPIRDDADDQRDWNMPTGPRTWGSGVGTGMQGRGMGQGRHSDPDYQQWRNEQLQSFDDDYEAFRRERYGKFAEEFNSWRSRRTTAKPSAEASAPTSPGTTPSQASSASGSGSSSSATRTGDTPASKQHG